MGVDVRFDTIQAGWGTAPQQLGAHVVPFLSGILIMIAGHRAMDMPNRSVLIASASFGPALSERRASIS